MRLCITFHCYVTYGKISLSNGHSVSGGVRHTNGGKNCDFRPKWPFISEKVRDSRMVASDH